jgi:hypothetical protein
MRPGPYSAERERELIATFKSQLNRDFSLRFPEDEFARKESPRPRRQQSRARASCTSAGVVLQRKVEVVGEREALDIHHATLAKGQQLSSKFPLQVSEPSRWRWRVEGRGQGKEDADVFYLFLQKQPNRKQLATFELCVPGSVPAERGGWLAKSELLGSWRGYAEAVAALTAVASECVHGTYHRRCDAPLPATAKKISVYLTSTFTVSSHQ